MNHRYLGSLPGPRPRLPVTPFVLPQNVPIMPISSTPFFIPNTSVHPFNSNVQNNFQIIQPQLPPPIPMTMNFPQNIAPPRNNNNPNYVDSSTQTDDTIYFSKVSIKVNSIIKII